MRNLLYIVAFVLVIGWLVGFFAYSGGAIMHTLLVFAIILVVFNVMGRSSTT